MRDNFFNDIDLRYPEYAIALEDVAPGKKGKFYIPILLPTVEGGSPKDKPIPKPSTGGIKNKDKLAIAKFKECNYVELEYPIYLHIAGYTPTTPFAVHSLSTEKVVAYHDTSDTVLKKGSKVIIVFVGGDINVKNIKIIGRV